MKVGDKVKIIPNTEFAHQMIGIGQIVRESGRDYRGYKCDWWEVVWEDGSRNAYPEVHLTCKEFNVLKLLEQVDKL